MFSKVTSMPRMKTAEYINYNSHYFDYSHPPTNNSKLIKLNYLLK